MRIPFRLLLNIGLIVVGCRATHEREPEPKPPTETPAAQSSAAQSAAASDPSGTWRGYIEAFSDPSDQVEVTLETRSGKVTGKVRLGSVDAAIPLEPMRLPDAGAFPATRSGRNWGVVRTAAFDLAQGRELAIASASVDGKRLRFDVEHHAFKEWCERQVAKPGEGLDELGCPIYGWGQGGPPDASPTPTCTVVVVPYLATDAGVRSKRDAGSTTRSKLNTAVTRPIDCAELTRCDDIRNHCDCRDGKCTGSVSLRLSFDLHVEGATADGSLLMEGDRATHRVRLERVSLNAR